MFQRVSWCEVEVLLRIRQRDGDWHPRSVQWEKRGSNDVPQQHVSINSHNSAADAQRNRKDMSS